MLALPPVELSGKELFAFLNGICKLKYDGDSEFTAEFFRENIFPESVDLDVVSSLMTAFGAIFDHAAANSFDAKELVDYLRSIGLENDEHANAWSKIWKSEEVKIHNQLVLSARHLPSLSRVSWRVDVLSASSSNTIEENGNPEPLALVEIQTKKTAQTLKTIESAAVENGSIFFEMDKTALYSTLATLEDVMKAIEKFV